MNNMLTKGMFDHGRYFGIRSGTIRPGFTTKAKKMVHNGTWYNKVGERLGYGDLDSADLINIRDGIPHNEVFFILRESAMFKEVVGDRDRYAPGSDFCVQECTYAIFRGKVYMNRKYESHTGEAVLFGEGPNAVEVTYTDSEKLLMHLAAIAI